jgi:hypothetical protein
MRLEENVNELCAAEEEEEAVEAENKWKSSHIKF